MQIVDRRLLHPACFSMVDSRFQTAAGYIGAFSFFDKRNIHRKLHFSTVSPEHGMDF